MEQAYLQRCSVNILVRMFVLLVKNTLYSYLKYVYCHFVIENKLL